MDKEVINELVDYLKHRVVENSVEVQWKKIPMFTGFTGAANVDEKQDEFEEENIELQNKKYNEAIRYLEALSDFTIGD